MDASKHGNFSQQVSDLLNRFNVDGKVYADYVTHVMSDVSNDDEFKLGCLKEILGGFNDDSTNGELECLSTEIVNLWNHHNTMEKSDSPHMEHTEKCMLESLSNAIRQGDSTNRNNQIVDKIDEKVIKPTKKELDGLSDERMKTKIIQEYFGEQFDVTFEETSDGFFSKKLVPKNSTNNSSVPAESPNDNARRVKEQEVLQRTARKMEQAIYLEKQKLQKKKLLEKKEKEKQRTSKNERRTGR